jgi:Protein of unknown function (DUF3499)
MIHMHGVHIGTMRAPARGTFVAVARQCARAGCSAVATATFTFDSTEQTVWLDAPRDGNARAGELCERHANKLMPPLGWRLDDRRATVDPSVRGIDHPAGTIETMLRAHTPLLARAFEASGNL